MNKELFKFILANQVKNSSLALMTLLETAHNRKNKHIHSSYNDVTYVSLAYNLKIRFIQIETPILPYRYDIVFEDYAFNEDEKLVYQLDDLCLGFSTNHFFERVYITNNSISFAIESVPIYLSNNFEMIMGNGRTTDSLIYDIHKAKFVKSKNRQALKQWHQIQGNNRKQYHCHDYEMDSKNKLAVILNNLKAQCSDKDIVVKNFEQLTYCLSTLQEDLFKSPLAHTIERAMVLIRQAKNL